MSAIEKKSRPHLLTWLCLGSGIFGFLWISMFVVLIRFSLAGNMPAHLFPGLVLQYLQAGCLFIFFQILFTGLGITGVILMWHMKKSGFYLYSSIKTLNYFLPVLFIGTNHLNFPGLLLTSIPIFFYGIIFTSKLYNH